MSILASEINRVQQETSFWTSMSTKTQNGVTWLKEAGTNAKASATGFFSKIVSVVTNIFSACKELMEQGFAIFASGCSHIAADTNSRIAMVVIIATTILVTILVKKLYEKSQNDMGVNPAYQPAPPEMELIT